MTARNRDNVFSLLGAQMSDAKNQPMCITPTEDSGYDSNEENTLLDQSDDEIEDGSEKHERKTAPLLSKRALNSFNMQEVKAQFGLLAQINAVHHNNQCIVPDDRRLYINSNAPFSAVICGVQGSGKSHTVSTFLESMLIPKCPQIGDLSKPLSGLVLHFGEGGSSSLPCEAAWVGVPISEDDSVKPPPVVVYVAKSSLQTMKATYAPLGKRVKIKPLVFSGKELDCEAVLSLMGLKSSENAPLYMLMVLNLLREEGELFDFPRFLRKLENLRSGLTPAQIPGFDQRMTLFKSFTDTGRIAQKEETRFVAGQLTIIDLSDVFIDAPTACNLFEIIIRLFIRADVGTGKALLVDEAHKYLDCTNGLSGLTQALLSLIRQQRHLAMRVIISTQEPTVLPPVLLDLTTVTVLHRFSSPAWWQHIQKHLSADVTAEDFFDKVVTLKTGQALVIAPTAYVVSYKVDEEIRVGPLVRGYMLIKTRRRVTKDGGASVLVVE